MCERCHDPGKAIKEYTLKGRKVMFCLDCAIITAQFHDISPQPEVQEAEAEPEAEEANEPEPEAQEAEEPESTPRRRRRY